MQKIYLISEKNKEPFAVSDLQYVLGYTKNHLRGTYDIKTIDLCTDIKDVAKFCHGHEMNDIICK